MSTPDLARNSHDGVTTTSDLPFNLQGSLTKLEEEKQKLKEAKRREVSIAKIQKVQPYLRNREEFGKSYSPKLVSFGPIHPGDKESKEDLKAGEHYKWVWAAMYLEDTNQNAEQLCRKVRDNLPALMELYTEDAIEGFRNKEKELAWIFLLDGCAVLQLIEKVDFSSTEKVQTLKIKIDQLIIVVHDLLLLENQLPYQLLKLLSNDDENKLNHSMSKFLENHHMIREMVNLGALTINLSGVDQQAKPTHLLHLLRSKILGSVDCISEQHPAQDQQNRYLLEFPTYRNIQELKAAGISVKRRKSEKLTDIAFDWRMTFKGFGRLHLSELIVDDFTLPTFLNLIAYEMCPDFVNGYEISCYVAFLESLIDHADDVKELRKAGILHNALGSDEEVANLFNAISTDLVPPIERYGGVRRDLEKRYKTKHLTWMAEALYTHFSSPWAFLGFAGAVIALFLTFVQTWLAMHPPPNGNH